MWVFFQIKKNVDLTVMLCMFTGWNIKQPFLTRKDLRYLSIIPPRVGLNDGNRCWFSSRSDFWRGSLHMEGWISLILFKRPHHFYLPIGSALLNDMANNVHTNILHLKENRSFHGFTVSRARCGFFACGLLARNAVAILSHGASGSDSYELRPRPLREQTHHASLKVCMHWTGRQMTSYSEITIWSSDHLNVSNNRSAATSPNPQNPWKYMQMNLMWSTTY